MKGKNTTRASTDVVGIAVICPGFQLNAWIPAGIIYDHVIIEGNRDRDVVVKPV